MRLRISFDRRLVDGMGCTHGVRPGEPRDLIGFVMRRCLTGAVCKP